MRYLLLILVLTVPVTLPTLYTPGELPVQGTSASSLGAASEDAPLPVVARYDEIDVKVFDQKRQLLAEEATVPARALRVAQSFVGMPYVHGVLDRPAEEELTLNLRQLDCWTFVEYAVAMSFLPPDGDFQTFGHLVQQFRYYDGVVNGYGSRLHYWSDWLLQAEKRGQLRDVTAAIGGVPYKKDIRYISQRPAKYPRIKDPNTLQALRRAEDRINAHSWHFIPKTRIAAIESQLREGDLIMLTSVKPALDIAHQGFAVKRNGRIYLMHASSLGKRVVITAQPLAQYIMTQRGQSGIMVARLP